MKFCYLQQHDELEGIMVNQRKANSMTSLLWNLKYNNNEYNKIETNSDTENKIVITNGEKEIGKRQ